MEEKKNTCLPAGRIFLILDGNALLHRAYHALPPLTTKEGQPIGAVYGFFSMLLRLVADVHPYCVAVTFDRPKPTFRQALFTGYQAQRPRMEDDLASQLKILHDLLKEAGIAIFEVDGFEADDVIGTLSAKVQSSETIIVSGDRDLLQLVNKSTKLLVPIMGITNMKLYGEEEVKEKFGLTPLQIIDFKALVGDASDNYPGVHGVGPKTATTLIKRYGDIEKLYEKISEVEKENPNLALKLAEGQQMAVMAKKLATIVTDVPFNFEIDKCWFGHLDKEKLIKAFERHDIKSLVKRVNEIFSDVAVKEKKKEEKNQEQLDLLN